MLFIIIKTLRDYEVDVTLKRLAGIISTIRVLT